jgi:tetracycline resistance efflux pump
MQDPVWTSVIPPLLAIGLAIVTRQVILSLSIGLWMGAWLLGSGNPLVAIPQAIDAVINVFTDPGDTRVLVFTLVIGGLIATIEKLGGVRGFIHLLQERKWVTGPGRAQWLAFGTGVVVFIESNITLLIAGAISRPLFDRYRVSREKLAYIIDAIKCLGRGHRKLVSIQRHRKSDRCFYWCNTSQFLRYFCGTGVRACDLVGF